MPDKAGFLKVRLNSLEKGLSQAGSEEKTEHITQHMADTFNAIRNDIIAAFPDLASHLPGEIRSTQPYLKFRQANATYLDVETYIGLMSELLDVANTGDNT